MNKLVSGAIGVSIKYTADEKIYLPDIMDLKGKRIKHIDVVPLSLDVDGNTLINNYDNYDFYLSLMEANTTEIKISEIPFSMLDISKNSGNRFYVNKIVDFPNSYIVNKSTNAVSGQYIFLVFWYDEPAIMQNVKIDGRTLYDNFECIATSSTTGKFLFGENRTLVNKKFRNILFPFYGIGTTTPKGNTTPTATDAFLTLQKNNRAFMRNVPLRCFWQIYNSYALRLQNITFDFTNSYIAVAPSLVSSVSGKSFFFNAEIDDEAEA